jgi:hypothetical protein
MFQKALLVAVLTLAVSSVEAQAVDATKEAGKSVAEGTQEGADKTKAALESGGNKAVDRTKGAVHGAKAKNHRHKAKEAAAAAVPKPD